MVKVGITGGIGSGKSVIGKVFATLGIPVLKADDTARHLMDNDPVLKKAIVALLGADVYQNGTLDRARVSDIIFKDPARLQQLNALVHPATIQYGKEWMARQNSPYIIKEAAIFFESGSNREMDIMVGASAPLALRIARTMQRGGLSRERVLEIMAKQMNDEEKMKLCDHIIINNDIEPIIPQVEQLHELLLEKALHRR